MKLEFEVFSALCHMKLFRINEKSADENDFGSRSDKDVENAGDYCCGNMTFERNPSNKEILNKYNITEEEYQEICGKLEKELSFGDCGRCA